MAAALEPPPGLRYLSVADASLLPVAEALAPEFYKVPVVRLLIAAVVTLLPLPMLELLVAL